MGFISKQRVTWLCLLALATTPYSYAAPLLDIPLRNLTQGGVTTLGQQRTAVLMMLFAPDCRYCHMQVHHLNQWIKRQEQRQSQTALAVVGVGIKGNIQALKKEAFSLKADFPLLMASPEFIQQLGEAPGTPILILLDIESTLLDIRRGTQNLERLEGWLSSTSR